MRSAGGSRLAPDRVFEGIVEFRRRLRASPARSARPSAPRSRRPTAEEAAEPCVGTQWTRCGRRDARRRRGRRRAQVIEATRGGPGDAVEGGGVLREERERRE